MGDFVVAQMLVLEGLLEVAGDVEDGVARAHGEEEGEDVDEEAVVGEDVGGVALAPRRVQSLGIDVVPFLLLLLIVESVTRGGGFLGDDPVAEQSQGDHGQAASATAVPGKEGHGEGGR